MNEKSLTDKELHSLENKLKTMHKELADSMADKSKVIKEPVDKDLFDAIPENEDKEISQIEDEMEETQIHMVEDALQRIADNTYGKCLECGKSISFERLMIVPFAPYCVKCEEKHEE